MEEMHIIWDEDAIYLTLKNIFKNRFNFDIERNGGRLLEQHLLGREIGFAARDLIYLCFDIEEAFGITLSEEAIGAGRIDTFRNILGIISDQLQQNFKTSISS